MQIGDRISYARLHILWIHNRKAFQGCIYLFFKQNLLKEIKSKHCNKLVSNMKSPFKCQ